jgi:2-keto-4-pentenoate hydratase
MSFDPAPAAATLARAWRDGTLLDALPPESRPRTIMDGYDIQDRLIEALGQQPIGWKLGMGSALQKTQTGVGRSIAGRILRDFTVEDGGTIPLPNDAPAVVEFEIAYVLARDLRPDAPAIPAIEAVGETRVTFELVLSRFRDRRAVGWPSFAADNGGFQALVLGPAIDPADIPELRRSLVVTLDGAEAARGLTGEDVTDPVAALSDLAAVARERGTVLPAGSVISTGTVSKPFPLAGAAAVEARFLGRRLGFRTVTGRGNARPG